MSSESGRLGPVGSHDTPLLLKGVHSGQRRRVVMGTRVPDPRVEGRLCVRCPSGWQPAELWVPQAAAKRRGEAVKEGMSE